MKVIGWIMVILAGVCLVAVVAAIETDPELVQSGLSAAISNGVLGAFLISRAKKKEREENDKNEWKNNNS